MSFLSYNVVVSTAEGDGRHHTEILSTLIVKIDLLDLHENCTIDGNERYLLQEQYLLQHRNSADAAEMGCSIDDDDNHSSKALTSHSGTTCSTGYDTFFDNGFEFVDDEATAESDSFSSCGSHDENEYEDTTSNRSQYYDLLTRTENDENSFVVRERRDLWMNDAAGAIPLQRRSYACLDDEESTSFQPGTSTLDCCDQSVSESQIEIRKTRNQAMASTRKRRSSWPTPWGSAQPTPSSFPLDERHDCPQDQDESSRLPDQERHFIHGQDYASNSCDSVFCSPFRQVHAKQRKTFDPTFIPQIDPIWRGPYEYEELSCEEAMLIQDKELINLLEKTLRETDIGRLDYIHAHLHIDGDDETDDGLAEEMSRDLNNLDCLHCEEAGLITDEKLKMMIGMTLWETDIHCLDYVDAHYYSPWYEDIDDGLTDELENLASITEAIKGELGQIQLAVDEHDRISERITIDDLRDSLCRLHDKVSSIMNLHLPIVGRPIKGFRHLWSHRVRIHRPGSKMASFVTESRSDLVQLSMESNSSVSRGYHPNATGIGPQPPGVLFVVDALKLVTGVGKYLLQTDSNAMLYEFFTLISDEVSSDGRVLKSHCNPLPTACDSGVQKNEESVHCYKRLGGSHPAACTRDCYGTGDSEQPIQKIGLYDLFSAFLSQTCETIHGQQNNASGSCATFGAILLRPEANIKRFKDEPRNSMTASQSETHFRNATGNSYMENRKDGASLPLLVRCPEQASSAQSDASATSTLHSDQGTLSPVESNTTESVEVTRTLAAASNMASLCSPAPSSAPNESNISRTIIGVSTESSLKLPENSNAPTRVPKSEMQDECLIVNRFWKQRPEPSLGSLAERTEMPWEITCESDQVSVDSEISPITYRDIAFDRQEEHFFRLSHLLDCDIQYERTHKSTGAVIDFEGPDALIRASGARSTASTSGSLSSLLSSGCRSKDPIFKALDAALDPPNFDGFSEMGVIVCDSRLGPFPRKDMVANLWTHPPVRNSLGVPFRSSIRADCPFDYPVTTAVHHALSVDANPCEISQLWDLGLNMADTPRSKGPSDPSTASSIEQVANFSALSSDVSHSNLRVQPTDDWVEKSEVVKSKDDCFRVLRSAEKHIENVDGSTWVGTISENGRSRSQDMFSSPLPNPCKAASLICLESSFHEINPMGEVLDFVYSPPTTRDYRFSLGRSNGMDQKSAEISEQQAPLGTGLFVNQTQSFERSKVDKAATALSSFLPGGLIESCNSDVRNSSYAWLVAGLEERYSEMKSKASGDDAGAHLEEGFELELRLNYEQAPTMPLQRIQFGEFQPVGGGPEYCSTYLNCGESIMEDDDMIIRHVEPSCHWEVEDRIEQYEVTVQDFHALSIQPSTCCDVVEIYMRQAPTGTVLLDNQTIQGGKVDLSATSLAADSLPRDPIESCNSGIGNSSYTWLAAEIEETCSAMDSKASDDVTNTALEEGFELELQLSEGPMMPLPHIHFDAFQAFGRRSAFFSTYMDCGESILEDEDMILRHAEPCHCEFEDRNEQYEITVQDIHPFLIQPSTCCDVDENGYVSGQVDEPKPRTCHRKDFAGCATKCATDGNMSFEDTTFPESVLIVGEEALNAAGGDGHASIQEFRGPIDLVNVGIVAKEFAVEVEMCPNNTEHYWEEPHVCEEVLYLDPHAAGLAVHVFVEQGDLGVEMEFSEDVGSGQFFQEYPNPSFGDPADRCSALVHPDEWDKGKPPRKPYCSIAAGRFICARSSSLTSNNVLGSIELSMKETAHQVMRLYFGGGECSKSATDLDSVDSTSCSSESDRGMQPDSDIAYSSISENDDFGIYQYCRPLSQGWFFD